MTIPDRHPRHHVRTAGMLGVTLLLACILAYQAVDAARSQRRVIESVLHDYALFAAEQYITRAFREVDLYGSRGAINLLNNLDAQDFRRTLLGVDSVRNLTDNASVLQALDLVTAFYRISLTDSTTETTLPLPALPTTTILEQAHRGQPNRWPDGLVVSRNEDGPTIFQWARPYPDASTTIFGFAMDNAEVMRYLASAYQRGPLLPTSLTSGTPSDSLLFLEIVDSGGNTLYTVSPSTAPPTSTTTAAVYSLGERFDNLGARVTLRPGVEHQLVIGGLPSDRLPITVGLVILTAIMIAATIVQLRRERELATLRADFVANVSHELRTPLAQIRMFAETLTLDRVRSTEEHDRSLAIIDKEARRLTHLVNNVLLFSKAEREPMVLAVTSLDVYSLIQQSVETFGPLLSNRNVSIDIRCTATFVRADPNALGQVLLNLIDNALKYGPDGQQITVEAVHEQDNVIITITDEGPGIPPHDRERVWRRFVRLGRERDAAKAGTGIGLAVVADLVHAMHGTAEIVPSSPGTSVRVTLPEGTGTDVTITSANKPPS